MNEADLSKNITHISLLTEETSDDRTCSILNGTSVKQTRELLQTLLPQNAQSSFENVIC